MCFIGLSTHHVILRRPEGPTKDLIIVVRFFALLGLRMTVRRELA